MPDVNVDDQHLDDVIEKLQVYKIDHHHKD